jgi:hypothetical protein
MAWGWTRWGRPRLWKGHASSVRRGRATRLHSGIRPIPLSGRRTRLRHPRAPPTRCRSTIADIGHSCGGPCRDACGRRAWLDTGYDPLSTRSRRVKRAASSSRLAGRIAANASRSSAIRRFRCPSILRGMSLVSSRRVPRTRSPCGDGTGGHQRTAVLHCTKTGSPPSRQRSCTRTPFRAEPVQGRARGAGSKTQIIRFGRSSSRLV